MSTTKKVVHNDGLVTHEPVTAPKSPEPVKPETAKPEPKK